MCCLSASAHARVCVCVFAPERGGEFEGPDPGSGEAERVPVGDLLDGAVEALDVVSLQHQNRLTGVDVNLQRHNKRR